MTSRCDTPRHDEREDAYVAAARVAAEREEAADAISGQLAERSPALTIITVRREHAIHAEAALRSTLSETAALEKLSAFMVRVDADVDLCYPGNHGGPDDAWLVTVTRQGANDIRESFGKTLAEAINKAVEAADDD